MSWFFYRDQEKRAWRKGIALRVRDLPKSVVDQAKMLICTASHTR